MDSTTINIRPGVRMLELFASLPYKEWYALGELVDNAIQSYAANRVRLVQLHGPDFVLKVSVNIRQEGGGEIEVSDNAAGISSHDWERAMRVAVPPEDTRGLSQFGVGLKAAACWFSRQWSVESRALGESVARSVEIDVTEAVQHETEEVRLVEIPKHPNDHGTRVTMRNLRRKPWGMGIRRIKDHLASIYREFLRQGDVEIWYNGAKIEYQDEPVLYAPYWETPDAEPIVWRREFSGELRSGKKVSGWLAIRSKGKQSVAGLALLYRRKVIVGAGDSLYKPEKLFGAGNTFRSQRLFGEIDVSAFDVSHTKDSLLWADEVDEFLELILGVLRDESMPIHSQAENFRAPKSDPIARNELDATAQRLHRVLVELGPAPAVTATPAGVQAASFLDEVGMDYEAIYETSVDGDPIRVQVQLVRAPHDDRWLWHDEDVERLRIVLNRSHPFMRKYCEAPVQDLEAVWMIGLAVILGAKQGHKRGSRMTNLVIEGINDYVRRFAM